jgi:hypothetical protein
LASPEEGYPIRIRKGEDNSGGGSGQRNGSGLVTEVMPSPKEPIHFFAKRNYPALGVQRFILAKVLISLIR